MSLKPCRECGALVSHESKACPHCGVPRPAKPELGTVGRIVIGVVILGIIGTFVTSGSTSAPSADPGLSRDLAVASQAGTAASSAAGDSWSVDRSRSEMDGSSTISLTVSASGEVQGWLDSYRPDLAIRCKENKTELYIVTGMSAQPEYGKFEEYGVRLRFDDGSPVSQDWSESTDQKALFAPEPVALAKRLTQAKTLRFEFTPFNASRAIASFPLAGLATHLRELAQTCHWNS